MVLKNNCTDMRDFIMTVNCYNGIFGITAKSLETNVAVVMRVDCSYNSQSYISYIWYMIQKEN
jgi:hypothetical protein